MKYHKNSVKRCQWCNIWYLAPWDYNDHLDSKHVSCELCEGYLRDEQNLEEHNERHHSKQPKPAPTPEATQDIDPEDRPHECRYCDARFQEASELKAHVNGKHRTVPCLDCSKRFVTEVDRTIIEKTLMVCPSLIAESRSVRFSDTVLSKCSST